MGDVVLLLKCLQEEKMILKLGEGNLTYFFLIEKN